MAVPSSGSLSLYGLAKEKELNNYDNTIPISTYNSYYATPISLGNLATGSGGFDATNTGSDFFPNSSAPHGMIEWYGYDHDYIWIPYYGANGINKAASYLSWPYGEWGTFGGDSLRRAIQEVIEIGNPSNVYQNGYYSNYQRVSEILDFTDWGDFDPFFVTNGQNSVRQISGYNSTSAVFQMYIQPTSAWIVTNIVATPSYATIRPASITYSDSYIYIEWNNTSSSLSGSVTVYFELVPNPNL